MAGSITSDFEQRTGKLVLLCDTATFEQVMDVLRRHAGASVPLSVPPTPVREVAIVLAADQPPPRVGFLRNLIAVLICVLILAGPVGLITMIQWTLK